MGPLRGEDKPSGRQGASKITGLDLGKLPVARFGQEFLIFTSVLGSHFGIFFDHFLGPIFDTLLGGLRDRSGTHFGVQKRSKSSPKRSPRAAKTRSQSKTLPNQKLAFRLGGSSLFGFWGGPRRGPAEAKDAILQAKNLQKRGSKSGPKKVTKNDDEGTKKRPKMEPNTRPKTDPKNGP